jgi:hypothetical protein
MLYEVLCLLDHPEITTLPKKLDTFKQHMERFLPLLSTTKHQVKVSSMKQSTCPPSQNISENVTSSQITYCPQELFHYILSSKLGTQKLHLGMAEYSDNPVELWHSHAWGSSLITTSGQYASSSITKDIFLPGDFVEFPLQDWDYGIQIQLGRIIFTGYDTRTASPTTGHIVLKIQPVIESSQFDQIQDENFLIFHDKPDLDNVYLLVEDSTIEVLADTILHRVSLRLHYQSQPPAERDATNICQVLNLCKRSIRPCIKMHPLRAELELRHFGREYFLWLAGQEHVCSVPFQLFIDDFGAHRNMYRAIKGFYITPAGLSYQERRSLANSFTLTLAPHGAELDDTVPTFEKDLGILEKGFYSKLNGQSTIITAAIMAFTGDMPQQAKNSGALGYQARIGCRSCYASSAQSHLLHLNTLQQGRYHFQIESLRDHAKSLARPCEQKKFYKNTGMQPDRSPLELLTPTLDLVLSRPYDLPHSDWQGLGTRLQKTILRLFTSAGKTEYTKAIQCISMPAHWPRIPSLEHRDSWTLSEHGRALILTPIILRCQAKPSWFQSKYYKRARFLLPLLLPPSSQLNSPLEYIIRACSIIASSTAELSIHQSIKPSRVQHLVNHSRRALQYLVLTASSLSPHAMKNFRTQGKIYYIILYNSTNSTIGTLPARIRGDPERTWIYNVSAPVVHAGIHFPAFVAEYGPLMNCNVLNGEQRHRYLDLHYFKFPKLITSLLVSTSIGLIEQHRGISWLTFSEWMQCTLLYVLVLLARGIMTFHIKLMQSLVYSKPVRDFCSVIF